ncbi:MAG: hypothetical protein IBX57_00265 [Gammaproteobacteria bacterium]|nr:hypothetical protein [Gammaproteobacteria bacterium]
MSLLKKYATVEETVGESTQKVEGILSIETTLKTNVLETTDVSTEGLIDNIKTWWQTSKDKAAAKTTNWNNYKENLTDIETRLSLIEKSLKGSKYEGSWTFDITPYFTTFYINKENVWLNDFVTLLKKELKRSNDFSTKVHKESVKALKEMAVKGKKVNVDSTVEDFDKSIEPILKIKRPNVLVPREYFKDGQFFRAKEIAAGKHPGSVTLMVNAEGPKFTTLAKKQDKAKREVTLTIKSVMEMISYIKPLLKNLDTYHTDDDIFVKSFNEAYLVFDTILDDLSSASFKPVESDNLTPYFRAMISHKEFIDLIEYNDNIITLAGLKLVINTLERFAKHVNDNS